jgi:hypothetical protein
MILTVLALALSYRKFFPKPRFDRSPVADIS